MLSNLFSIFNHKCHTGYKHHRGEFTQYDKVISLIDQIVYTMKKTVSESIHINFKPNYLMQSSRSYIRWFNYHTIYSIHPIITLSYNKTIQSFRWWTRFNHLTMLPSTVTSNLIQPSKSTIQSSHYHNKHSVLKPSNHYCIHW